MKFLLILCFIFVGCASNAHKDAGNLELERDYHINQLYPKDGTNYILIEYPNIDEVYRSKRIQNLINNDSQYSCFESDIDKKKSFNYIEIISRHVSVLRDFSIRQKQTFNIVQKESLINGQYLNIRVEQRRGKISVRTKDCYNKNFNGKSVWVISEIYE